MKSVKVVLRYEASTSFLGFRVRAIIEGCIEKSWEKSIFIDITNQLKKPFYILVVCHIHSFKKPKLINKPDNAGGYNIDESWKCYDMLEYS